jgi:GAF domain-containing protein
VAEGLRLLDLLQALAHELIARTEADACIVSRTLGDVRIIVAQATADGVQLEVAQAFLATESPATLEAELGFLARVALPLELRGERWGIVELYRRTPRPFGEAEVAAAEAELSRLP